MDRKKYIVEDNLTLIKEWEDKGTPMMEVARNLSIKYDTLKKYLKILGVSYKINPHRKGLKHHESRKTIQSILNGNSTNASKRRRLIEEGIKDEKCECCGLSEWMGKPIPLELHHKDFNPYNNDISNLECISIKQHAKIHAKRNFENRYVYRFGRCSYL